MNSIDGINNWKLIIQRSADSIEILRAETCDRAAALPDELFGLPVRALSARALAPGAPSLSGEEVLIRHGRSEEEWGNKSLVSLALPSSLETIGDYAFMNCRKLKELSLPAAVSRLGVSIFMNCRELQDITLQYCTPENADVLSYLLSELKDTLNVTLQTTDGKTIRLVFPEYYEQLTENEPTHFFNYTIEGGGYPYHIVCRNKKFYFSDYDALWKKFIYCGHDSSCALRLAWTRLRYPEKLSAACACDYSEYIAAHLSEALCLALEANDISGLSFLLHSFSPSREDLAAAAALAREKHLTEATALLLEKTHIFSGGLNKNYDL